MMRFTRNISNPRPPPLRLMNSASRLLLRGCIRYTKRHSLLPRHHVSRRSFNLLRKKEIATSPESQTSLHPLDANSKYLRLSQDNLFHPLINSPILGIRKKAMAIKSLALCPASGLLEGNEFTCPNCGFPTHCSEEHYRLDQERHELESCDTLRMINEDLHDMQSGRQFPEFTLRRNFLEKALLTCRTTLYGESTEFLGLGSYFVHAVHANDFLRKIVATCNKCPIISIHNRGRPS